MLTVFYVKLSWDWFCSGGRVLVRLSLRCCLNPGKSRSLEPPDQVGDRSCYPGC